MMILEKLLINRGSEWARNKGELQGVVEFKGPHGKVELPLDEELSRQIVGLCADAIVRNTRVIAEQMTADVLDGLALPAPEQD